MSCMLIHECYDAFLTCFLHLILVSRGLGATKNWNADPTLIDIGKSDYIILLAVTVGTRWCAVIWVNSKNWLRTTSFFMVVQGFLIAGFQSQFWHLADMVGFQCRKRNCGVWVTILCFDSLVNSQQSTSTRAMWPRDFGGTLTQLAATSLMTQSTSHGRMPIAFQQWSHMGLSKHMMPRCSH